MYGLAEKSEHRRCYVETSGSRPIDQLVLAGGRSHLAISGGVRGAYIAGIRDGDWSHEVAAALGYRSYGGMLAPYIITS